MKRLLVVVDYQIDFVDGTLGFPKAAAIENPIAEKIKEYRKNGDEVVFTLDTHSENYLTTQEGENLPVPHCIQGTKGAELYGKISQLRQASDTVFEKPTFGCGPLFTHLKSGNYDCVELVGLISNICVISNAVIAKTALPEALVMVDAACTASNDDMLHEAALSIMDGLQIKVTNRK